MRKALLPALLYLSALLPFAVCAAEETSNDFGLQLQLDAELRQELLLRPGMPPAEGSALLRAAAPAEQDVSFRPDYQLGQGWHRGSFYISGYAAIDFHAPHAQPAELALDDLSLFVGGHLGKWVNPFAEAEISDHAIAKQGGGVRGNGYIVFERIYNDMVLFEHDTLRVGKMLTPVGNWNLIHAAPLVPTNTRPMTTYRSFSEYATGLSWLHDPQDGTWPDWQLYWQPGAELPRRPRELAPRVFRNVFGAHINLPLGLMDKAGASLQHGKLDERGEAYTLYGLNITKSLGKLRLQSEAIYSHWSGAAPRAHNRETGLFILADYGFTSRWHGIVEWERYQDHAVSAPSRNVLVGFSYRPSPIVWKLEYVRQMGDASFISSGWRASFSTLF